jgi:nucleoside-diphosphate-sugar epimerase
MIALKNPPEKGVVQTWNQLSEWHSMNDIAQMVIDEGRENGLNELGLEITAQWIDTPRVEFTGDHYYNFVTENLTNKGYVPTRTIKEEIGYTIKKLFIYKNHLDKYRNVVIPRIIFKDTM